MDGSGYPRGLAGGAVSPAGRLLAAADYYHSRIEPRPHRQASGAYEAAVRLRAEVKAGRLDAEAAHAVLTAAGHRVTRRQARSDGLTSREVEVLGLLAQGLSNREIAERTVPPSDALVTRAASSKCLALKQIGQTRYRPPAASYRFVRSGSDGHPSQATPWATP